MPDPKLIELAKEAIKQHEAATPGPWRAEPQSPRHLMRGPVFIFAAGIEDTIAKVSSMNSNGKARREGDAELIASMRSREPLLAKAVLEADAEIERLRELVRDMEAEVVDCGVCPICNAPQRFTHREGCRLAAALSSPAPAPATPAG